MIKTFTKVVHELEKEYSFNVTTGRIDRSIECDTILKDGIVLHIAFFNELINVSIKTTESVLYCVCVMDSKNERQFIEILEKIQKEIEKVL